MHLSSPYIAYACNMQLCGPRESSPPAKAAPPKRGGAELHPRNVVPENGARNVVHNVVPECGAQCGDRKKHVVPNVVPEYGARKFTAIFNECIARIEHPNVVPEIIHPQNGACTPPKRPPR